MFKRITNTKLCRQGGKNSGRDGIIQIAKTLFSLWFLVKDIKPKDQIAADKRAQRAVIRRNKRLEERSMQQKLKRLNEPGIPVQNIVFSDTSKVPKHRKTCPTEQASER